MQIRRSRLVLVPTLALSALALACGQPPVPVSEQSTPPSTRSRELPAGHPPTTPAASRGGTDVSASGAPQGGGAAQVAAADFHFSGVVRISEELHSRTGAAVFLSVRDQQTNELILSSRHTMAEFEQDGDLWVAPYRLDESHRMMGGASRPRDVSIKASYTPGGMLPAIGSTQPIEGEVTKTTAARAGVEDHEIVLQ